MDLLHHEVLKAAFFCCLGVPLDLGGLFLDFVAVQIKELDLAGCQTGHFHIADIVNSAGILKDSRHIGAKEAVSVAAA